MPTVKQAVAGWRGFDVNATLPANKYSDFARSGNNFAIRYIPRSPALVKGNLTAVEIDAVMSAKIALSVVQHCPEPGWQPSASLGTQYGQYAGQYALEIGLPKGMNIWLDLETPSTSATAQDTIAYANAWYDAIQSAGYIPGVYLGYGLPLSPDQLHDSLKFSHYWRAYNGPYVATRGYQIIQETQQSLEGISFDPNRIQADNMGDLPMFLSPD